MSFNAAAARAKRPCPLWVDAFLRDTQHLAADEVGAYMLILMVMWSRESCDYPDDDHRLARVCRVSLRLWKSRLGPTLRPFFQSAGGVLVSKRLREEAAYVERQCKAQSDRKAGENSDKPLKDNGPASSVDKPRNEPSDASRDHPSQQPNTTDPSSDGSERGALSLALGDPEPPKPKPKSRRKPEVPIPDDWAPSGRNIADAQSRNLTPEDIRREADRFRDHHLARDTRFRDWDAAWRTWVSRARPGGGGVVVAAFPGRGGSGRSLASIAAQRRLADAN